jgi:DNA/RNA-binding domain of Phe-tRNA-synthetase-like protein
VTDELDPQEGFVAPSVAAEFPLLRLWWLPVDCVEGKTPPGIKARLHHMSGRMRGATAMMLRQKPIPHAYRVFFRHIGLDPDVHRIPVEAIVVERLMDGEYRSRSLVSDALRIACVETEVPVWAVDADALQGDLMIRPAYDREILDPTDETVPPLPEGRLVVADNAGPVAVLFSDPVHPRVVHKRTRRAIVFSVQVEGVPSIAVSEALWTVFDILEDAHLG